MLRAEQRDRNPRRAIILVIENAGLPAPRLAAVFELRREAVDRRQQPGRPCVDQPRERLMVWPMETIDPLVAISSRVARNDVAAARRRDQRGMLGLAWPIAPDSRPRGPDRGGSQTDEI